MTEDKMQWMMFCELLRGYAVYFGHRRVAKWELYHGNDPETVFEIAWLQHKDYRYVQKEGWKDGKMVGGE